MDKSFLDIETVTYVVDRYFGLLEQTERMALYHAKSIFKFNIDIHTQNTLVSILRSTGWINEEQTLLDIVKEGQEHFDYRIAKKIIEQNKEDVFFNYCKKCGRLARTPAARQCHHCGYSWHHLLTAKFKINAAYEVTGRGCFLIGELVEGEICKNYIVDLVRLGFSQRTPIRSIEFVWKRLEKIPKEDTALRVNQLSKRDMRRLEKEQEETVDIFKF